MSRERIMSTMSDSLAGRLGFDEEEVTARKALLGFGPADAAELRGFLGAARAVGDAVAADFYLHLRRFPDLDAILRDRMLLDRLHRTMEDYIVQLFGGEYGLDYVESRLQMGYRHARMGLPPKHFVFSLQVLKELISGYLMRSGLLEHPPAALEKIFVFDLELVFDAYIYHVSGTTENSKLGLLYAVGGDGAEWFLPRPPADEEPEQRRS